MGDLITDALVWGAKQNGETVDAAITNGGGIRATIKAGDITKKDVNTVLPFGNTLSIVKVTGTELAGGAGGIHLLYAGRAGRLPAGQRHSVHH